MSLTNHIQQAYKSFKGNDDGIDNDDDDGDADNDVVGGDVDHLPTASIVGKPKQYGGWGPTRGCQK